MFSQRREATQAGRFYPADPNQLREAVRRALAAAERVDLGGAAKGLIAPHAGYQFSGPTAGWAYKQVEGAPLRRVVVLAPSHYVALDGASIFQGRSYLTPLGEVVMDEEIVSSLRERKEAVQSVPSADRPEHSLEAQLPFLQVALGEFLLVPLLVGGVSDEVCAAVADALLDALRRAGARLGEDTLVVASSDLYHGPSAEACERSDAELVREIERFDPVSFQRRSRVREVMACGAVPIAVMMRLTKDMGATALKVIHRTNSYKVYPVHSDYVVGYLAAAVV